MASGARVSVSGRAAPDRMEGKATSGKGEACECGETPEMSRELSGARAALEEGKVRWSSL